MVKTLPSSAGSMDLIPGQDGLSIKGCIGLQQERRKDTDVLNILFKITGMRVSDPREAWRIGLDPEE